MAERKNRDLLVLATKFTTPYRSWEMGKGKTVNYSGNHKRSLHMSVRDSLKKLQTDYIDILYLREYLCSLAMNWVLVASSHPPLGLVEMLSAVCQCVLAAEALPPHSSLDKHELTRVLQIGGTGPRRLKRSWILS